MIMNAPVICWGIFLKKLIGKSLDFIDILIILKKLDTFQNQVVLDSFLFLL